MDLRRRYRLNLGKYPVVEVIPGEKNITVVIDMQNKMFIRMAVPLSADVRVSDLLTLYTEVLAQERT
jgi:hypothetical protein